MRDYTFYDNDIRSSEGLIVMVKVYEAKHDDDIVFFIKKSSLIQNLNV